MVARSCGSHGRDRVGMGFSLAFKKYDDVIIIRTVESEGTMAIHTLGKNSEWLGVFSYAL